MASSLTVRVYGDQAEALQREAGYQSMLQGKNISAAAILKTLIAAAWGDDLSKAPHCIADRGSGRVTASVNGPTNGAVVKTPDFDDLFSAQP